MLLHREKVCQNLRWMGFIGKPVPYRHTSILSKFFNLCLTESAILDTIVHATKDAGGVLHCLLVTNMRAAWADVGDVSSLVERGYFESAARARRVLLEDESYLLAFQVLHLCACIFRQWALHRRLRHGPCRDT